MMLIDELEDATYFVIYHISKSGGFTVMVWYEWGGISNHRNSTGKFYIKSNQDILPITLFKFS